MTEGADEETVVHFFREVGDPEEVEDENTVRGDTKEVYFEGAETCILPVESEISLKVIRAASHQYAEQFLPTRAATHRSTWKLPCTLYLQCWNMPHNGYFLSQTPNPGSASMIGRIARALCEC